MNILQILPELNVGGVETGTIDFAKFLLKTGHNPVVVSNGGPLVDELESLGIKHYKLPVHEKSVFTIGKMIKAVAQVVKQESVEIIHCRSRVPAWIGYFVSRRTGVPFITTCHGCYSKHLFSSVMGWGKFVIAPSNAIAVHMVENFKVPYGRVRVIPRSVDTERFRFVPPQKKDWSVFNIGIIGRITTIKGHVEFLNAMAQVRRFCPEVKIWVVGEAPASKKDYMDDLQLLTRRLGLSKHTEFLGNQKDIPAVLSQLNVLVLATRTQEAFGRVIIEAQASGVAVVATKVGGVVDIVRDGETGLLVPAKDSVKMAEAVITLVKDRDLREKIINAANVDVRARFTIANMGNCTLEVYRDALSKLSVLVVKFGALGDVILSVPALRALRKHFGNDCRITCLTGKEGRIILGKCPYIDELIVYDYRKKGWLDLLKLSKTLRKRNFDLTVDLQNNRKSHLAGYLSMSARRLGYDNGKWSGLLNIPVPLPKQPMPPVQHQFQILSKLGIQLSEQHLQLWVADDDRVRMGDFLNSYFVVRPKYLAAINLGASARWVSKQWPVGSVAECVNALAGRGVISVLIGQDCHRAIENDVFRLCEKAKPVRACGKTSLGELVALIEKCDILISPDSAPLHIAAALDVPFVALFGPTDPLRHLPPAEKFSLLRKDLKCSPCYRPDCRSRKCMSVISPKDVLAEVERILKINQ